MYIYTCIIKVGHIWKFASWHLLKWSYILIHSCVCVCVCVCACTRACACAHTCTYIHIYLSTHTHTHACTPIYKHTEFVFYGFLMPFCLSSPSRFTPPHNLCSPVFGLMPFGWLRSTTVTPYFR
jgi:hypothetical protein